MKTEPEQTAEFGDVLENWEGKADRLSLCGLLPDGKYLALYVNSCELSIREEEGYVCIRVPRYTVAVMGRNHP